MRAHAATTQEAELRIHARGTAVAKAVTIAEITRRRVEGVHQMSEIGIDDNDRPWLRLTLSLQPLDESAPGYQPPLSMSELAEARALEEAVGVGQREVCAASDE